MKTINMTREEQIYNAAFDYNLTTTDESDAAMRGFSAGAEWADATRWVKVEDADISQDLESLCMFDGSLIRTGYYSAFTKKFYSYRHHSEFFPTHICYFPEPPKAEQ